MLDVLDGRLGRARRLGRRGVRRLAGGAAGRDAARQRPGRVPEGRGVGHVRRDDVPLGHGPAGRLGSCGHGTGRCGGHHDRNAGAADVRRLLADARRIPGDDDRHVVGPVGLGEQVVVQIADGHPGLGPRARKGAAHVTHHITGGRLVDVDRHRQRRVARLVDVGGRLQEGGDIQGKIHEAFLP